MDVNYFCLHVARPKEVVAISDDGYIIGLVYIDEEGLFKIPNGYSVRKIKSDYFDNLDVRKYLSNERMTAKNKDKLQYDTVGIPCHFVNV